MFLVQKLTIYSSQALFYNKSKPLNIYKKLKSLLFIIIFIKLIKFARQKHHNVNKNRKYSF